MSTPWTQSHRWAHHVTIRHTMFFIRHTMSPPGHTMSSPGTWCHYRPHNVIAAHMMSHLGTQCHLWAHNVTFGHMTSPLGMQCKRRTHNVTTAHVMSPLGTQCHLWAHDTFEEMTQWIEMDQPLKKWMKDIEKQFSCPKKRRERNLFSNIQFISSWNFCRIKDIKEMNARFVVRRKTGRNATSF